MCVQKHAQMVVTHLIMSEDKHHKVIAALYGYTLTLFFCQERRVY
jgi:hypothetical protein